MKKKLWSRSLNIDLQSKGFTLIELLVSMGLIASLIGFITINLNRTQRITSLVAEVDKINADLKSQQVKAMNGVGSGIGGGFGIHIESNAYTIFSGVTYNPSDPANSTVQLESNIILSTTFPDDSIVFSQRKGEIVGYSNTSDTITLTNTSGGELRTMTLNRYGVVSDIH